MKALKGYLDKTGLTQRQFADLIGCSQSLVSQWISGDIQMTNDWALEVEKRTHQKLLRQDLLPKLFRGMAA
jgi:DNA-binding transcriptional regulator YdaS (Cro superfamily)